jgi:hypothetical protein
MNTEDSFSIPEQLHVGSLSAGPGGITILAAEPVGREAYRTSQRDLTRNPDGSDEAAVQKGSNRYRARRWRVRSRLWSSIERREPSTTAPGRGSIVFSWSLPRPPRTIAKFVSRAF